MLERVLRSLAVVVYSAAIFTLGYLIIDDYVQLHQRVSAIEEELFWKPLDIEATYPPSQYDYIPLDRRNQ